MPQPLPRTSIALYEEFRKLRTAGELVASEGRFNAFQKKGGRIMAHSLYHHRKASPKSTDTLTPWTERDNEILVLLAQAIDKAKTLSPETLLDEKFWGTVENVKRSL